MQKNGRLRNKLLAVTFDSPGIGHILAHPELSTQYSTEADELLLIYLSSPNWINTCKPYVGQLIQLRLPPLGEYEQAITGSQMRTGKNFLQ